VGDIVRLEAENDTCREIAQRTGLPHFMWHSESKDAMRALLRGDFGARHDLDERFRLVHRLTGDENVAQEYAAQQFYRAVELDQAESALPLVEAFVQREELVLTWSAALAWMQWDAGRIAAARETLDRLGTAGIAAQARETGGGIGIAGLAEVAARIGNQTQRRQLRGIVQPVKDCLACAGYGWLYFGCFSRYSGLIEASLGAVDAALADFDRAIDLESRIGASIWRAYAELDKAELLLIENRSREEATELLESARLTAFSIGSPRLKRRYAAAENRLHRYQ